MQPSSSTSSVFKSAAVTHLVLVPLLRTCILMGLGLKMGNYTGVPQSGRYERAGPYLGNRIGFLASP